MIQTIMNETVLTSKTQPPPSSLQIFIHILEFSSNTLMPDFQSRGPPPYRGVSKRSGQELVSREHQKGPRGGILLFPIFFLDPAKRFHPSALIYIAPILCRRQVCFRAAQRTWPLSTVASEHWANRRAWTAVKTQSLNRWINFKSISLLLSRKLQASWQRVDSSEVFPLSRPGPLRPCLVLRRTRMISD